MADEIVTRLLEHNEKHYGNLSEGHFEEVQDGQEPHLVSICCSDSRISQEGMFAIERPGELFTPSNIGNQAWDKIGDKKVVNGNLLYPIVHTGTQTIAVVGHTSCGAVTAAYQHATEGLEEPEGIQKHIDMLQSVVAEAIELNIIDTESENVINQLVEYNVDQQVEFLRESEDIPEDANIYGFVYDFQSVYGGEKGKLYLINVNGERELDTIKKDLPENFHGHVQRLTQY